MMELVDMRDLGSRAAMRVGSSPHARTTSEQALHRLLRRFCIPKTTRWASGSKEAYADEEK